MQLLNLHIRKNSIEIFEGWKFSENGVLLINGILGLDSLFGKIYTNRKISTITHGFLNSRGELVKDGYRKKKTDRFLLLIIADGEMIHLPEVLYKVGSVKVKPIMKRDRTMSVTAISLSKKYKTDIRVGTATFLLEYDNKAEKLYVTETTPVQSKDPVTQQSWWDKVVKKFRTLAWNYLHPHRPWRT
jgi:hypothetical protein